MVFQEPKVEFINLQLQDSITTSGGGNSGIIGQCDGEVYSAEECVPGQQWNL